MSNTPKWLVVGALAVVAATGATTVLTQRQPNANQQVFGAAPTTEPTEPTALTEIVAVRTEPEASLVTELSTPVTETAAPIPATPVNEVIPNEMIDYPTFKRVVNEVEAERKSKRLSEHDFLVAMNEPNVVLLDVRNPAAFQELRIRGAVNLPLTNFTVESLERVIPTNDTKVLLYCNNNFRGLRGQLQTKIAPLALNLLAYTSLKAHGYTNVYELGPIVNLPSTVLPLEGILEGAITTPAAVPMAEPFAGPVAVPITDLG
jgi:Rhodanese-like domain